MAAESSSMAAAAAAAAAEEEEEEEESGLMNAVDAVPFMLHVLLVFVFTWLVLPVNFNGFFLLAFLIIYLVQVEKRGREKESRGIASAERRRLNTRRTFDEGETARWLNEGIKSMWPVCMEKFASKHFFGPMAPHFLDKHKPWIVREAKIDIESLSLGTRSPVFNFIRALEKPPEGDHLAYEADMDFHAGTDMNAEMSVLLRGGARTTFYISNLHIEGKVRISVKFLKGWPVIGRVRFCFASTPQVTMSYTPYYRKLPDVSLIPVLANIVMKTLDNAMVDSIVEPNMLVADIEALASMLSSESSQGAAATYPSNVENKLPTLLVEILEATDLKVADRNGLSDPYVDILFGPRKRKTKYIRKTLNPKWENEQHTFNIVNWGLSNLLTLRVRDWNRLTPSHDLGIYILSLNELYQDGKLDEDGKPYEFGKRYVFYRRLEKVSRGYLRFAITVNSSNPPQATDEPGTSDAACETVTQEIKSEPVDYVVYDSPVGGTTTEMKRSKSETNLDLKLPKRHKKWTLSSHSTTHETSPLEALHEQSPMIDDETHDIITMPYGPHGAFTIFHPGSIQSTPPMTTMTPSSAQAPPPNSMEQLVDAVGVRPSSSRFGSLIRGLVRRRRPSQESGLADTMSEQSGSVCSIDLSTELKQLELMEMYRGPVRMDLVDTDDTVGPEEPPEMFVEPRTGPLLETIMSEETASSSVRASNSHSIPVRTNTSEVDDTTTSQPVGETLKGGSPLVPIARSEESLQQADKPMSTSRLPKTWYKKIKSLAAKAGKKKKEKVQDDANGLAYSSELVKYAGSVEEDGEDWDPLVSRSVSFTCELSPLDGVANHTPGESPELRKLMQETPQSRAAGSQSDRSNWASKVTQRIRDQSKSLRHLKPKLRKPTPPDSSLNSIPERPTQAGSVQAQRNGMLSI